MRTRGERADVTCPLAKRLRRAVSVGLLFLPAVASADEPSGGDSLAAQARSLARQMQRRGEPRGEVHLMTGALYARRGDPKQAVRHLRAARRNGISRGRVDLVLGGLYRRMDRYDAAFSTLVRVLVAHPRQPHALVELWMTLYESHLTKASVQTDRATIRDQLAEHGLFFPRRFRVAKGAATASKKLTAAGYNALLGGRVRLAIDLFKEAITALPSHARAHGGLGAAWARSQNNRQAAGAYLLYLELNPNAADAAEIDQFLMRHWRAQPRLQPN